MRGVEGRGHERAPDAGGSPATARQV